LDDLFPRVHVDRVVVGRAAELALLRRRWVAHRHAQPAADAEVGAHRAHHPPITIGFFDDAAGDRAGGLANGARKRAETAVRVDDRDRLRGLLAGPRHHFGPHVTVIIPGAGDWGLRPASTSGVNVRLKPDATNVGYERRPTNVGPRTSAHGRRPATAGADVPWPDRRTRAWRRTATRCLPR